MGRIVIEVKVGLRRTPQWARRELELDTDPATVAELLEAVVRHEVREFAERKSAAAMLQVLTERQLNEGAEAGRIVFGDQEPDPRRPDVEQAIEVAKLAFQDGLFFLFVNEQQKEYLADRLSWDGGREVMFLRLTPLVGG